MIRATLTEFYGDKIPQKHVAVKALELAAGPLKLLFSGRFCLQSTYGRAKIGKMLWGLVEEGNSGEPAVRSSASGLSKELITSGMLLFSPILSLKSRRDGC